MRERIIELESFKELESTRQKFYESKFCVDLIKHYCDVAESGGIEWLIASQSPSPISLRIVRELLTNK